MDKKQDFFKALTLRINSEKSQIKSLADMMFRGSKIGKIPVFKKLAGNIPKIPVPYKNNFIKYLI